MIWYLIITFMLNTPNATNFVIGTFDTQKECLDALMALSKGNTLSYIDTARCEEYKE